MKKCLLPIVSLFMVVLFSGCATMGTTFSPGPALIEPVATVMDTATVGFGEVSRSERAFGAMRVLSEPVYFQVGNARIAEIFVFPGDVVTEGQLLARLDVEEIHRRIAEANQQLSRLRALHNSVNTRNDLNIELAEAEYHAAVTLAASQNNPAALEQTSRLRENIEWLHLTAQQTRQQQAMEIDNVQRRLQEQQSALIETDLIATFDGTITMTLRSVGDWIRQDDYVFFIAPEQAPFLELIGTQLQLRDARNAVRLTAHFETGIFELEHIDLTIEQLRFYTAQAGTGSPVFPIRFHVLTNEHQMPPLGAMATVYVYDIYHENILRIPSNAFFVEGRYDERDDEGLIVRALQRGYVHKIEDDLLTQISIVGDSTPSFVAVLSGLEEGDVVFVRP